MGEHAQNSAHLGTSTLGEGKAAFAARRKLRRPLGRLRGSPSCQPGENGRKDREEKEKDESVCVRGR